MAARASSSLVAVTTVTVRRSAYCGGQGYQNCKKKKNSTTTCPNRHAACTYQLCTCACTPTIPRPIGTPVPVSRHRVSSGHATSSLAPRCTAAADFQSSRPLHPPVASDDTGETFFSFFFPAFVSREIYSVADLYNTRSTLHPSPLLSSIHRRAPNTTREVGRYGKIVERYSFGCILFSIYFPIVRCVCLKRQHDRSSVIYKVAAVAAVIVCRL